MDQTLLDRIFSRLGLVRLSRARRDEADAEAHIAECVRLAGLVPQQGDRSRYKCACGSIEAVFLRPSYRDPKYVEYALCRACLSRTACCVTIGNVDVASAPDMPSHLFPGCGSDGAEFTVTHGKKPLWGDVSDMLYEAIADAVLVEYDEGTGKGYFRVIDGDAPPVGAVIPLIAQAEADLID
ncbi:hypothetical protein G3N96_05125 [Burkholderia sp. Se-20373]|uniref:hypothetical protein n=1 Tax=Burkholderia sp. Se-20373 TaxID=2703898 RepID=UPI00197D79D1|nr:hypothetical protein [Burkholderia sp. Se-20373]MBN3744818.1 hypothetical protein [Burkholderia sp. Se-20373]